MLLSGRCFPKGWTLSSFRNLYQVKVKKPVKLSLTLFWNKWVALSLMETLESMFQWRLICSTKVIYWRICYFADFTSINYDVDSNSYWQSFLLAHQLKFLWEWRERLLLLFCAATDTCRYTELLCSDKWETKYTWSSKSKMILPSPVVTLHSFFHLFWRQGFATA